MNSIPQNLTLIQQKINHYETHYNRQPGTVKLLAVSKKQPIEKIKQALAAGQVSFGENYLQEALTKITTLADEKIDWHFIGPIQSNKTKKIAENFSWVHSVNNIEIAKRLNDQRPSHLPPLNICLQINISGEHTKSGTTPENALFLAKQCALLPNLTLRGLMAIPEPKIILTEQRAQLHPLKLLYDLICANGLNIDTLSMGMSDDMEAAIAEGATMVRIGTAIFGQRI